MKKRYVLEFINDRMGDFTGNALQEYKKYSGKVLRLYNSGKISSLEAVLMIANIDSWELNHGTASRFNGGYND